ncbi:hypothetical protein [Streptomyces sp. B1I3]|uniref:hypothetical protein n=1 Tax=Streptomyces sp. B1I3 TaxID=3042264 RepID=UPI00278B22B7|nr:hypothetical protein [Streptomyces sp. B1I3]MDQ0792008.1 flagellar biosynthesis GTPase FlhF [Streptomyces sp. B1I3]
MTTSPPQVNGHRRPLPVITDWQAFLGTPAEQPVVDPTPTPTPEPTATAVDLVAQAEADAIRTKAYADAEEQRINAEAEAKAIEIKAEAEAEKMRLANERSAMRMERDRAEHDAHLEDIQRKREKAARLDEEERAAAKQSEQAEAKGAEKVDQSANRWRNAALAFAIMCAVVALPVQMSAFYNPNAKWLLAAPIMLEAGAWVILAGAAAAVAAHRPHWHYRLIAWSLAFVAAGVNLWHGLEHFDPATAIGTAFASLAGPGVWDLHEHGRIRRRDGVLSWRERRAERKAAEKQAAQEVAQEKREAAREEARQKARDAINLRLAEQRRTEFPDEWKYALKLAVAMGETTVTDAVWDRAWDDKHAAKPGVTANSISARNAAAERMKRVLERDPANTLSKGTSSQRVPHLPPKSGRGSRTGPKVRGTRRAGDAPPFVSAARKQAAITAKNTATEEQK